MFLFISNFHFFFYSTKWHLLGACKLPSTRKTHQSKPGASRYRNQLCVLLTNYGTRRSLIKIKKKSSYFFTDLWSLKKPVSFCSSQQQWRIRMLCLGIPEGLLAEKPLTNGIFPARSINKGCHVHQRLQSFNSEPWGNSGLKRISAI